MLAHIAVCTDCGDAGPPQPTPRAARAAFRDHACEAADTPRTYARDVLGAGIDGIDILPIAHWAVRQVAPYISQSQPDYAPLLSDALLGIARAAQLYNPNAGASLPGWCRAKAVYAVRDGIRDRGPLSRADLAAHRTPDDLPAWQQQPLNGDAPIEAGSTALVWDSVIDLDAEAQFHTIDLRDHVDRVLAHATGRDREVLVLHYLHGLTLAEIGARWGVTESRVCQIEQAAMRALRARLAGDTGE